MKKYLVSFVWLSAFEFGYAYYEKDEGLITEQEISEILRQVTTQNRKADLPAIVAVSEIGFE